MIEKITDKQLTILQFINSEVKTKGYPPSVREICTATGLKSTSTVHGYLNRLEKNGCIRRDPTKPRAIEILVDLDGSDDINPINDNIVFLNKNITMIPIVGKVSAGQPILAVENIEDSFPFPTKLVDNGTYFMLQISGDSMHEIGIMDSDYVLVKQQVDARNGEVVIALIDDSATCKTFYKESNRFRLQPENSLLEPIFTNEVSILGIVKGVYRNM